MKKWNFKVKGNPQEIIKKLASTIESFGGFIFKIDRGKDDAVLFNFRKPIKYPDQILHRNRTIVNGKILKTEAENETDVEISFTQHMFMILTISSIILFGVVLMVTIPRVSSGISMYLLEGILLALGIVLWIAVQKKIERDIQKHKTLIAEILEAQ